MEKMNPNRPLVTMHIACYNQEWCIRETLEGAFSQTYSPLDIVISDDCSTDRTWQIVLEMVERYRREDGRHNVILNRNPENSYRAPVERKNKIRAYVQSLWHGELIVQADGDDVSLPNRVEDVVSVWMKSGQKADLLMSGAIRIDKSGKCAGTRSCYSGPSGSSMAYTKRMEDVYGCFTVTPVHGDDVRFYRAQMLGGVKLIDKSLLKYRICEGVSQVLKEFREPMIRNYTCIRNNRKQLLLDVEKIKCRLSATDYQNWKRQFECELRKWDDELLLWESDSFLMRWRGYWSMKMKRRFLSGMVVYGPLLLLPRWIGNPLLNLVHKIMRIVHVK